MGQTWRNQTERRYELRRPTAEGVLGQLNQNIERMVYTPGSLVTLVTTTYMDTPEHYYYNYQLDADGARSIKVRVREYFPLSDDGEYNVISVSPNCYLERKERNGTTRLKQRIQLPKSDVMPVVRRQKGLPGEGTEVDALRHEVKQHRLIPLVTSAYERRVWSNSDLRITFDERIRFYRPPTSLYDNAKAMTADVLGPPIGVGPKRILEIKHSSGFVLPDWLDALTKDLTEMVDYSKFADGMKSLGRKRKITSLTGIIEPL